MLARVRWCETHGVTGTYPVNKYADHCEYFKDYNPCVVTNAEIRRADSNPIVMDFERTADPTKEPYVQVVEDRAWNIPAGAYRLTPVCAVCEGFGQIEDGNHDLATGEPYRMACPSCSTE